MLVDSLRQRLGDELMLFSVLALLEFVHILLEVLELVIHISSRTSCIVSWSSKHVAS